MCFCNLSLYNQNNYAKLIVVMERPASIAGCFCGRTDVVLKSASGKKMFSL